jgi:selenocysteine lyase/cysteine desulfurase
VVEQLQREHGIVCSSRAGAVRVSLAPYNDESDVEALTRALASIDSSGGGGGGAS